jgi:hypothetical protein
VQILYNKIHVDTISTMFYNDTFILLMTILKSQKLVEHTFELNFEMYSNEFCMAPIHLRVNWMDNTTKVTLNMNNSPTILYNKIRFFNFFFFQLLQIWKESNRACFMPIQIHNLETHILCKQYFATKLNEKNFNNNKHPNHLLEPKLKYATHQLYL